jgi:hypothetical protein
MLSIAIVDLEGRFNAPVAVTLDSLQIVASLAGRPMADVAYIGAQRGFAQANCLPWSALNKPTDVVIVPGLGLSHALESAAIGRGGSRSDPRHGPFDGKVDCPHQGPS